MTATHNLLTLYKHTPRPRRPESPAAGAAIATGVPAGTPALTSPPRGAWPSPLRNSHRAKRTVSGAARRTAGQALDKATVSQIDFVRVAGRASRAEPGLLRRDDERHDAARF
jgi:hypothetical protein